MKSTFKKEDVILLLKDITGMVEPLPAEIREKLIQSGKHYSEMLPLEYIPTDRYIDIYESSLDLFGQDVADAVAVLSDKLVFEKGTSLTLVSLARAGIPAGILVKRYIKWKYGFDVPHYAISIIRGRGIDKNAMKYILNRHPADSIQFIDGWTGKGAIDRELKKDISEFDGVSDSLAVIADPAGITKLCGTYRDILIPSSCLNSTVSGLISRTFLRDDIIGPDDFHGAAYYGGMEPEDRTYEFIDHITGLFRPYVFADNRKPKHDGLYYVAQIAEHYGIKDINLVKPGIGETTRVLLRRIPDRILISGACRNDRQLRPVVQLAEEKNVRITYDYIGNYKCCGLIRQMADT